MIKLLKNKHTNWKHVLFVAEASFPKMVNSRHGLCCTEWEVKYGFSYAFKNVFYITNKKEYFPDSSNRKEKNSIQD